jgi:hypothetical protein
MSTSVAVADLQTLLLDINAAARLVGVGSGVIRGWVAEGLPFIRAGRGGKKMFSPIDLKRFIERQKETIQ